MVAVAVAVIVLMSFFRGFANDHVVQKADAKQLGGLLDAVRELIIRAAGCGVAAGVVVGQDEAVGIIDDGGPEDVPGVGNGFIDGAGGYFHGFDQAAFGVHQQNKYRFFVFPSHGCRQVVINVFRGIEGETGEFFLNGAAAQFKDGGEGSGFGHAYSFAEVANFRSFHPCQSVQRSCGGDEFRRHFQDVFSFDPCP